MFQVKNRRRQSCHLAKRLPPHQAKKLQSTIAKAKSLLVH